MIMNVAPCWYIFSLSATQYPVQVNQVYTFNVHAKNAHITFYELL